MFMSIVVLIVICFLYNVIVVRKNIKLLSLECIEIISMPKEKQKKLRKGKNNKKMYYSHKRVKLNLNK